MPRKGGRYTGDKYKYKSIKNKIMNFLHEHKYATIQSILREMPYLDYSAVKYGFELLKKEQKIKEAFTLV